MLLCIKYFYGMQLPPTWARELRELLIATVDLLHIAHEFIPTIHAFHQMDDDLSGTLAISIYVS